MAGPCQWGGGKAGSRPPFHSQRSKILSCSRTIIPNKARSLLKRVENRSFQYDKFFELLIPSIRKGPKLRIEKHRISKGPKNGPFIVDKL